MRGSAPETATPSMRVVWNELERLKCHPHGSPIRFAAWCPSCRLGTLTVREGDRGALVFCDADCDLRELLDALSLTFDDLCD